MPYPLTSEGDLELVRKQRAGTETEDVGAGSHSAISKLLSHSYNFT